jgi:hypothetical protein
MMMTTTMTITTMMMTNRIRRAELQPRDPEAAGHE